MFIVDGIAYAGTGKEERKVDSVKVLDGMILIIRFKSGEERLFDATCLLEYPVFQPLKDDGLFRNVKVEFGTLSWDNGKIDIDPETMTRQENKEPMPSFYCLLDNCFRNRTGPGDVRFDVHFTGRPLQLHGQPIA